MRPNQIKKHPTTVQNTQEKTPVVADSNISTIHLLTKDQDIFVAERYNTEITNKEINQTGKVLKINLKKNVQGCWEIHVAYYTNFSGKFIQKNARYYMMFLFHIIAQSGQNPI